MIVRPFVRLAARFLDPGPLRLQMVKLAHELDEGDNYFEVFYARRGREPKPAFEASEAGTRRPAA